MGRMAKAPQQRKTHAKGEKQPFVRGEDYWALREKQSFDAAPNSAIGPAAYRCSGTYYPANARGRVGATPPPFMEAQKLVIAITHSTAGSAVVYSGAGAAAGTESCR